MVRRSDDDDDRSQRNDEGCKASSRWTFWISFGFQSASPRHTAPDRH
jgi:hypothetical protein